MDMHKVNSVKVLAFFRECSHTGGETVTWVVDFSLNESKSISRPFSKRLSGFSQQWQQWPRDILQCSFTDNKSSRVILLNMNFYLRIIWTTEDYPDRYLVFLNQPQVFSKRTVQLFFFFFSLFWLIWCKLKARFFAKVHFIWLLINNLSRNTMVWTDGHDSPTHWCGDKAEFKVAHKNHFGLASLKF